MAIKHSFVNPIADGGDATIARPSDWNAAHVEDSVFETFGTPDTTFEFNSSSLTGLTAIGTAAAEDANTTIPGHYYVKQTGSGQYAGRYASFTSSKTAIIKLSDHNARANFASAGIFVGIGTPGRFDTLVIGFGTQQGLAVNAWTNPTTYSSTPVNFGTTSLSFTPLYLAILATSDSNVDYLASSTGYLWFKVLAARDPSITIGSVGMIVGADGGGTTSAMFDYLRVWNSLKTFPGV